MSEQRQFRNETNNRRINVYVGPSLLRAVDELAGRDRRERSEWIRILLERAVERNRVQTAP